MIGFVMIPVYTHVFTPADYGTLEILSMSTDVVSMLTGLGLATAVTRYYYHYDDDARRSAVVSSAVVSFVSLFAFVTVLLLPFADELATVLLGTAERSDLVRLALVSFFTLSLSEIPVVYLRARQLSTHVVLVGVSRLCLALGLNLLLVVFLRIGVEGVLYSTIVSSSLVGLVLVIITFRRTGLRLDPGIVRELVRYGAPLIAWQLGSFVIHYSNGYFLRAYSTLADIGIYSLAYKFAMLLPFFIAAPFTWIWGPKALEIYKADEAAAPAIYRDILSYYNVAVVACALGICLFADDVIRLIAGPSFHPAGGPIPLLCVGMVFYCYRQIAQVGATIRFRSDMIGLSTAIAGGLVILLNFVLIPRWGIMGAAAATALAFAGEYLLMDHLSRRVYPAVYPVLQVLRPLILGGAVLGAVSLLVPSDAPLLVELGVKLAGFGGFLALVPGLGGLSTAQRAALRHWIRDPLAAVRPATDARHGDPAAAASPATLGGLRSEPE
jgi:O-antigen/teichoic acid export membrane protein